MKKLVYFLVLLICYGLLTLIIFTPNIFAEDIYWIGASNTTSWSDPANWQSHKAPGPGDIVKIDSTAQTIDIDKNTTLLGIELGSQFNGEIRLQPKILVTLGTGGFNQKSGVFNAGKGQLTDQGNFLITGGIFNAEDSTILLNGDFTISSHSFNGENSRMEFSGEGNTQLSCADNPLPLIEIKKRGITTINNDCNVSLGDNAIVSGTLINNGQIVAGNGTLSFFNYQQNEGASLKVSGPVIKIDGNLSLNGGDFPTDKEIKLSDSSKVTLPCEDNIFDGIKTSSLPNNATKLTIDCAFADTVETITNVANTTIAVISAAPNLLDIFSNISNFKDVPFLLLRLLIIGLQFLGLKKKVRQWGLVYDSLTKQPVDPASVTLYKKENNQFIKIANVITDFQGRFGFLVDKGVYKIEVNKTDYQFPSELLKGNNTDGEFDSLYFGDEFEIKNPDAINLSIPVDQKAFNWNQAMKPTLYVPPHFWKSKAVLNYLLYLGFIVALISFIITHSLFDVVLIIFYVGMIVLRKFLFKDKKWGIIYDLKTKLVCPLATIKGSREIVAGGRKNVVADGLCLSDHLGRYYLILNEGDHFLDITCQNSPGQTTKSAHIGPIKVAKNHSIISPDIAL